MFIVGLVMVDVVCGIVGCGLVFCVVGVFGWILWRFVVML